MIIASREFSRELNDRRTKTGRGWKLDKDSEEVRSKGASKGRRKTEADDGRTDGDQIGKQS